MHHCGKPGVKRDGAVPFTTKLRRRLRYAVAMLSVLVAAALPGDVGAQDVEVPVAVQVPLFLKVMTFDRQRRHVPDGDVVIGITFQSGYRNSITIRDEATRALSKAPNARVRVVLIDLDRDDLSAMLQHHHVQILYVSPLRAISVATIAGVAATGRVITVTGVPQYVEQGLAVGVRLQGDRPRLMVNLSASKQGGADFTSELLKLAEVLP